MCNHFSSIGFRIFSRQEFQELINKYSKDSKWIPTYFGGAYLYYTTPEGCEIWGQVYPDDKIIGGQPHFNGRSRYRVLIDDMQYVKGMPLDGQLICATADEDLEAMFVVNIPNFRQHAALLTKNSIATLQITAIAEAVHLSKNTSEFSDSGYGSMSPDGSMISSGMFVPDDKDPLPRAILTGRIKMVKNIINTKTGYSFYSLEISTYGGTMDVVIDPKLLQDEPIEEGIIGGQFYFSGKVIDPLA